MNAGRRILRTSLAAGAALGVLVTASMAAAQTSNEVVVTANKRTERLKDVAMSDSAISGQELATAQALDLQDIATKVPGLNLEQDGSGLTRIILRGQNTGGPGANVATVIDDIPVSFSGATSDGAILANDFDPYDLDRIEVLRGPQGTLYGATAEGGLLKYVTKTPDMTGFHEGVEVGAVSIAHGGSTGSAKGFVNAPLGGQAALRVSGFYEGLPGWISNNFLSESKVNNGERYGGRASLLWRPTEDLSLRGTVILQDRTQHGADSVAVFGSSNPANPLGLVAGYNASGYSNTETQNKMAVYALNIEDNLHWARFQSITSYGKTDTHYRSDTPSLAPYLGLYEGLLGYPVTPSNQVTLDFRNNLAKFNQEFRLSSEPDNKLFGHGFDWQAGLFYTHEEVVFDEDLIGSTFPAGVILPGPIGDVAAYTIPSDYKEFAGYIDGDFKFTAQFDVEAGVRVARNTQSSQTTEGGLLVTGSTTASALPSISTSQTVATYSVAPRFHITPDVMVYGRIATGYRPGGPVTPIPGATGVPTAFNADNTINYEAGLKGDFFEKTLSVDLSVFSIDWKDIQILHTITYMVGASTLTTNVTGNGGTAVSQGAEVSIDWAPIQGLDIGFVAASTDAHLTAAAPAIGAKNGDSLPYVPRFSSTLSANYAWTLAGDYKAFVGGAWAYIGERKTNLGSQITLPSYSDFSLQTGLRRGDYAIELYGKNLSDARGVTSYGSGGGFGGFGGANLIRPRTIGLRLTANF